MFYINNFYHFPSIVWKPISAKTRYIIQWMKCVSHEKRCIFQVKRCIFQLVRCIILEIYISPVEMYISFSKWRPPDRNNTSHQLKYTSFHLKYTSLLMRNTFHPL